MSDIDMKRSEHHLEAKELDLENGSEISIDPAAEGRLLRKLDLRLLPIIWACLVMSYLDRTNIGNAKVGGMMEDLNMTSSGYALALSIFFIGYLLFEPPSNMILSRVRPSLYIPTIMVIWGSMSIAPKGIHNTTGMVIFRFFLGIVEAGFWPGCMLVMSCWYKPNELSKRTAVFYSGAIVAGAVGGLLAGGIISGMEGVAGTRGWVWLFIIEGIATVFFAILAFLLLPDYPQTTRWVTPEESKLAIDRLALVAQADEAAAGAEPEGHWAAFKAACKDPRTWTFSIIYTFIQGAGTISYFIPTLMTVQGYKGSQAQYMTVPIYMVSLVFSLTGGFVADKTKAKAFVVAAAGTLSTLSFIICATVQNHTVKYVFLCFGCAGIWTAVPVFLSWSVTMFDGREKRGIAFAFVNGIGNLASVYGSWLWPKTDGPRYPIGFGVTTALCGTMVILVLLAKWKFGDKGVRRTS